MWLWILHRSPITAPRWISTNGPIRVPAPIVHPYRFVNECTNTFAPNSTSAISRYGASFAGSEATVEVPLHRVGDPLDLPVGDAGEDRQRHELGGQALGDRERAGRCPSAAYAAERCGGCG